MILSIFRFLTTKFLYKNDEMETNGDFRLKPLQIIYFLVELSFISNHEFFGNFPANGA